MLEFNDGVKVDTSGKLRIAHLGDGYYVVGNGMMVACDSKEDAELTLRDLKSVPGVSVNGEGTDLAGLFHAVSAITKDQPTPWTCVCGKQNRGKDLSCWDGCGRLREQGEVTK